MLLLHILCPVGWFGAVAGFFVLDHGDDPGIGYTMGIIPALLDRF